MFDMFVGIFGIPAGYKVYTPENNQEFQVPKMEVLNPTKLFWGWVFPYISRIHTAYIGEDSSILGT